MPKMIVFMVILSVAIFGGLFLFANKGTSGSSARAEVGADDEVLQRLRKSNPSLHIEKNLDDDFNRIPVYRINIPNGTGSIPMPRDFANADSVVVEFVPCDDAAIPAKLKYPGATTTACVRVTDTKHVLDVFCYHAITRLNNIVTHYEGPSTGHRFEHRYTDKTGLDGLQPDGSKGLLYAYSAYESGHGTTFEVDVFVGYKRVRRD